MAVGVKAKRRTRQLASEIINFSEFPNDTEILKFPQIFLIYFKDKFLFN